MNLWAICKRELKLMFVKDVRRGAFILGAALVYLALFAMLYGPHILKNVPLVVFDEDQTRLSRSLVQAFDDSERFRIVGYAASEEDMQYFLREKKAFAALQIPADFSDAKTGIASSVLVTVNAGNLLIANTVTTAAQEIVAAFAKSTGTMLAETANMLPAQGAGRAGPLTFALRVLNNPTLSYMDFFVLGLAMAAFQQGVILAVGASIIGEYANLSALDKLPVMRVLAGKLIPYLVCGTAGFGLVILMANKLFAIPSKGSLVDLLLIAITFTFTAISFATLLASLCDNEVSFTKVALIYAVPSFILSGHIWPQYSMDLFTQIFSYTFPLFYFADSVRDLMISGHAPFLYTKILILCCLGLFFIVTAAILLKRRAAPGLTGDVGK